MTFALMHSSTTHASSPLGHHQVIRDDAGQGDNYVRGHGEGIEEESCGAWQDALLVGDKRQISGKVGTVVFGVAINVAIHAE